MGSLAVPLFGSWHIPSPVQQWRGNINYRFVRINTVCRREGEEENREAYLE